MADASTLAHEHGVTGHAGDHPPTNTGISNEKLAMWAFLGSECLLFGALMSTYFLYRNRGGQTGLRPRDVFDIPFTSFSSFVLLTSSLTMVLAVAAIQRGDHRKTRAWLVATAMLGATFIAGQIFEFTQFIREGVSLSTNVASGAFFVLTGFHGAHVTIGIVMLLTLWMRSLRNKLGTEKAEAVEIVGLYWHFVDVVWIVIFTVVYLIP